MSALLRFFRYSGVALISAGSDWLFFSVLVTLAGAPHLSALMVARVIGGLVSFFANRSWTWGAHRPIALTQQGRRFLALYGFSYLSAIALFSGLVDGLGIAPYPGKLATDALCFVGNFIVMNAYVFHRRRGVSTIVGFFRSAFGRRQPDQS
ncbi:GtrA family protein [Telmatospirillum sp.]|uniref:GtrA family protein n=1 Tax=Telmatospirillum sp. TaxID=2079197 RepID=UPI0028437746|nr:GtrA family protein [Telmatospirillum sp.]MDR3437110.1 GtrA family protein [Telmatospirillum sp.]